MVMIGRVGELGYLEVREWRKWFAVETLPFTWEDRERATDAFRRFGKGRHPAGLNFGDCMSYATAMAANEALLFKGNDFSRTDIRAAL